MKLLRFAGACAALAAVATAGCSSTATSPVPSGADWLSARGTLYHQPHYAATRSQARGIVPGAIAYIPYHGGPVILTPKFYLIFWGYKKYGDPDKLEPLLEAYTQSMGGSSHNNIETQYYETVKKKNSYITNPSDQYGGSWLDNSPIPKSPSDAQIAAEAVKAVAHFGGYDPNGVYVVATAHLHSEAGFGSHWCSYHSDTVEGKNPVPYANLPYMPDAGKECGADNITPPSDESGTDEGMTILAGHEFGESITDPEPFSAWYGVDGEIGDVCAWHGIENDTFGSKSYTAQPMVSDATESCVQGYPSS
jgi:hypothetical protein